MTRCATYDNSGCRKPGRGAGDWMGFLGQGKWLVLVAGPFSDLLRFMLVYGPTCC
jgi:hypothetical protein